MKFIIKFKENTINEFCTGSKSNKSFVNVV